MACLGHPPSLARRAGWAYTEAVISMATRLMRLSAGAGLILLLACSVAVASTNTAWFTRVWQTGDGLPNNQVTAIAQGPDGYLWIGTAVGLARFDGLHFTQFPYWISASNEDLGVSQLFFGRAGELWIRMRRGPLVHLKPDFSGTIPAGKGLPGTRAWSAIEDPDGCLWIAYPSGIWQVRHGLATQLAGYEDMPTRGYAGPFAIDREGNMWVAKGNGVYLFRNGRFEAVTSTIYRAHLAASRSGGVWIASGKQLLKCYRDGRVEDYGSFSTADIHAGTTVVMEDHSGAVWIGTSSGGLFRHDGSGFARVGTSHPDILSLAEDREGNLWVGTAGGGLDRINTRGVQLEGMGDGPSSVAIQSICEDTNGVLWGATQNGLLVSRVNGRWRPALTNAPWTNAVDCVVADPDGALWIGTRNSGLYCRRDGRFENWDASRGFAGHVVLDLLPASSGDLWIAEQAPNALQCLHEGHLRSLKLPSTAGRITALAEDAAGNIWAGSERGALMRVEGESLTDESALTPLANRSILCLYPTADGGLWIGYEGAGLGRLKQGRFNEIRSDQGLFDDYISQIVADGKGWFWFGGERGIFKVRREELDSVMSGRADQVRSINYGQNEGLSSVEANSANVSPYVSPTALRSHDGRLWFPLRKALAVVDPERLRVNTRPPRVLLSQVIMDGRIIASRGGEAGTRNIVNLDTAATRLRLPPAHRHLEFDFTAINLSAPENVRFRYQLVGFDDDWIDADKQRSASYSRLIAGHYQFRVEACVGAGLWNETATSLAFTVAPFFWQTWWFRLGALVLFTSGVIAIVRYISFRRLQAEMRLMGQRAALDKERARIARDLHDDLGCSLNKVALTLDMTQRRLETTESLNGEIHHCSAMVRQAAKSVDEIVWAINPRNDTLRYMVDYISQFAVEFLHAADIPCRVDLPDDVPDVPEQHLSPEARHNLFLVVKEALNNVACHAHASEVRLRVTAAEDQVAIVIEDNGRGFEHAPDNASCDGLRNMRQRMEEIGGRFEFETRPGAGTRVAFHYSWPRNGGR
jgi:signal transduction histidine kinase/ligand-binding sensor domain-containing protein